MNKKTKKSVWKKNKEKENNSLILTICLIVAIAATLTELMVYINEGKNDMDFSSSVIGLCGYFGMYTYSQQIINKNQFVVFGLIGLAIFLTCSVKQFLIGYHFLPLCAAGLPLLYIIYFKTITSLFYKDYPITKPTIVFASKTGQTSFQGDKSGYKPRMKERLFSLTLFMGFMATAFGLILIIKEITK